MTFLPCVMSRILPVSSDRKLDGWKLWTATDNRSPILPRFGYGNLLLLSLPDQQMSKAMLQIPREFSNNML